MKTPTRSSKTKSNLFIWLGAALLLVASVTSLSQAWAQTAGRPCVHCGGQNLHESLRFSRAVQTVLGLKSGLDYYNHKKRINANMADACINHFLENDFHPAIETGAPVNFGPCEPVGRIYPVPGGSGIPYYMSRTGVNSFGPKYTNMPYDLQWRHLSPFQYTPGGPYSLSRGSDGNFNPVRNPGNFGVGP
jgi:hypothetical protein